MSIGKVKKTRSKKKPYDKKQNDIISPASNTITPGNSGEVTGGTTTSEVTVETTTEEEEENPLVKIIRYVHYKLFERSVKYCDGCKRQFGDIAAGIISDQSLEMYKKHAN